MGVLDLVLGCYVELVCSSGAPESWEFYTMLTDKKHFCKVIFLHLLVLHLKLICLNKMPTIKTRPNHHLLLHSHYSSIEIVIIFYRKLITVLLILPWELLFIDLSSKSLHSSCCSAKKVKSGLRSGIP